jgi:uncharacterized protein (DUF58 family)
VLTTRGVAVFLAGLAMWAAARLIGSAGLEVAAIGLGALPFLAVGLARVGRPRLAIRRRLSDVRVTPGTRVTVELSIENRGPVATPLLLLEDRCPPPLGRGARLVVTGLHGQGTRRVTYTLLPQARGRYRIGPLSVDLADPFSLTRQRVEFDETEELLVTPEIEDLTQAPEPSSGGTFGTSRARHLFRTGEEFYTMRQYQLGDDLRRLHWPSVARTGQLMIRQDETSRRASGLVFLDSRQAALGAAHTPPFERAVSVAASVGLLLARGGFSLRLATAASAPAPVTEDAFLDALAGVDAGTTRSIGSALTHLRAGASPDTALVFVSAPPAPTELTSLLRAGSGFGPKLAILIHPAEPHTLTPDRRAQLEGRATQARIALSRAGWDCLLLTPSIRLLERWHTPRERRSALGS